MSAWKFTENNEWEAEQWHVFFEVDEDLDPKVRALAEYIDENEDDEVDYRTYNLEEIDSLPDEDEIQELHPADEDEEDDEDYYGSGYYPYEQIAVLDPKRFDEIAERVLYEDDLSALNKLALFRE